MSENNAFVGEYYWSIVPAAGIGSRMQQAIPKQYLKIDNKTILDYTLEKLCSHDLIKGVVVAISSTDEYWPNHVSIYNKEIITVQGGSERFQSVFNALQSLSGKCDINDWVLVHDAARPCLSLDDISKLIEKVKCDDIGGLLATPVRDTMKRANSFGKILHTTERLYLWHALTPQMFRYGMLCDALQSAIDTNLVITDEASALEAKGYQPLLIEGSIKNIKITRPEDLALAELYLNKNY
ncbi:2-C-methyl-D-erythritol 4-phosphate cytidylyltransferase [hydrothermal vent metagenome]|uniref:2-C-methyl-D-erythritol 4-phosphate cytidylyltransferase n=1 Tax=hydrothermal vent metagenome TaxID=652676 RepID=A0A3B0ZP39_9ZZZZ